MPLDDSSPGTGTTTSGHLDEDTVVLASLARPLPPPDQAHLDGCARCREEVAALTHVVTTARSWPVVEPVPVPDGTWAAIAGELGLQDRPPVTDGLVVRPLASLPTPVRDSPQESSRATRRRTRWLPVAAALLVGLGLGVVGARWVGDGSAPAGPGPVPPASVAVASAALEPLAGAVDPAGRGEAEVVETGGVRSLHLAVSGVAPAADGVLEVWLLNADGGLVSLGLLSRAEMTVALPADLDLARFDVVDVSREPLDGDPGHSADSVLRGVLTTRA